MAKQSKLLSALGGVCFSGLSFLAGCNGLFDESKPNITYNEYVRIVSERADRLAESSLQNRKIQRKTINVFELKTAIEMYLSTGSLRKAEEYAKKILEQDPDEGLRVYRDLQSYRDSHPNAK